MEHSGHKILKEFAEKCIERLDEWCEFGGGNSTLDRQAKRFTVCWAIHTFFTDSTSVSPRLLFSSPREGCGKSNAMGVLTRISSNGKLKTSSTVAFLNDELAKEKVSLLFDEAEGLFLKESYEGVGGFGNLLKCGYDGTASRERKASSGGDPGGSWNFGKVPVAFALINGRADIKKDMMSRIIRVELERTENSKYEHFDNDVTFPEIESLKSALVALGSDYFKKYPKPDGIDGLIARPRDNFELIRKIARSLGSDWLEDVDAMALCHAKGESNQRDSNDLSANIFEMLRSAQLDLVGCDWISQQYLLQYSDKFCEAHDLDPIEKKDFKRELRNRWKIKADFDTQHCPYLGTTASVYKWKSFENVWRRYYPHLLSADHVHRPIENHTPIEVNKPRDTVFESNGSTSQIGDVLDGAQTRQKVAEIRRANPNLSR